MDTLVVIAVDGLVYASWLFLISLGLTLIYGVLRILNIAHGSLYALGAYAAASVVLAYFQQDRWPYGVYLFLIGAAVAVGLTAGPLIERGLLRWMYNRDQVFQLLATYALFLILEDFVKLVWGVNPYYPFQPYSLLGEVEIGAIVYARYSFLLVGMAVVTGLALWLFIHRTRFGRLIVAVIHDPEISVAMGVRVTRVYVITFTLGAALAALGGALTAPMIAVTPGIAAEVIVLAFAVVVIGGMGSLEGAALGSLMVGVIRAAAVHRMPVLELFTIYLVMALVLLFRPYGLFAREELRRI